MRRKGYGARSLVTAVREVEIEGDGNLFPIQHAEAAVSLTAKWDDLLPVYTYVCNSVSCSKLNALVCETQLPSRERHIAFSGS
jgi:hypothetical protein